MEKGRKKFLCLHIMVSLNKTDMKQPVVCLTADILGIDLLQITHYLADSCRELGLQPLPDTYKTHTVIEGVLSALLSYFPCLLAKSWVAEHLT